MNWMLILNSWMPAAYDKAGVTGPVAGDTATDEVEVITNTGDDEEEPPPPPELPPEKVNPNVGEKEFGSARLKTEAEMTKVKRVRRETLSPRRGLALNPNYASTTGLNIGVKK